MNRIHLSRGVLPLCLALLLPGTLSALEAGPIVIHGAVSETIAYSDRYNYLGDTDGSLHSVNDELTLNGAYVFPNGLRFSAQLYAYKISGFKDITLDFASFDYSFKPWFGVRLGRNKEPLGLYGEAQDVDQSRPFALLPLGLYAKELRPLNATFDGLSLYGTVSLGSAGSLEYQVFGGRATSASADQPAVQNIIGASTPINIDHFEAPHKVLGVWLAWDTPIDGLRLGFNDTKVFQITMEGTVKDAAELALAPSDLRYAADVLGPLFGGQRGKIELDNNQVSLFAVYTIGNWEFSAEAFRMYKTFTRDLPFDQSTVKSRSDYFYVTAAYQLTKKIQLGLLYELDYADSDDRDGDNFHAVPQHLAWTKGPGAVIAYSPTSWLTVKLQAHLLNGTAILAPKVNEDAATWKANWSYVVLKTTLSF